MLKNALWVVLFSIILSGCTQRVGFKLAPETEVPFTQPENPVITDPVEPDPVIVDKSIQRSFSLEVQNEFFQQDVLRENKITLSFETLDSSNKHITGLKPSDIQVFENNIPVNRFNLNSENQNIESSADIVFVLDITGSMDPSIQAVKQKVTDFVNVLNTKNVKSTLCLVTYKDNVQDVCSKYVEDDPKTQKNENLDDFLNRLSNIRTGDGGDPNENALLALMAAAQNTPWHNGAQRMAILITDAGFHFAPASTGDAGRLAPRYKEALDSLVRNQVMTFIVGPKKMGYSEDFFNEAQSLPEATNGRWFRFEDVEKGILSLNDVFTSIADQIVTKYTIEYIVNNNPGLDPTEKLKDKNIQIEIAPHIPVQKINIISAQSSLPSGLPQLKKQWTLKSSKKIYLPSLEVTVDGNKLTSGYNLENGKLLFNKAPKEGSQVRIHYVYENWKENLNLTFIDLETKLKPENFSLKLNGQQALERDYKISKTLEKDYLLEIILSDDEDTFNVLQNYQLDVDLFYQTKE